MRLGQHNLERDGVLGWHFIGPNMHLGPGDPRLAIAGVRYGPLSTAHDGMSASHTIIDALHHAPGNVLCRVQVYDNIAGLVCFGQRAHASRYRNWSDHRTAGDSEFTGTYRKILWFVDFNRVLTSIGLYPNRVCWSPLDALANAYELPISAELDLVDAVRRQRRLARNLHQPGEQQ